MEECGAYNATIIYEELPINSLNNVNLDYGFLDIVDIVPYDTITQF